MLQTGAKSGLISLPDGIRMEYFLTSGGTKTPIICLPGLTRNALDFVNVAPFLAATGHDVYRFSFRGRGGSDRDTNYLNYHPTQYRDDVIAAMRSLSIPKAHFVGTSLGGIVTMLLNQHHSQHVASAILNDIGPELNPIGLAHIATMMSNASSGGAPFFALTLDQAAQMIKKINERAFPDADDQFWRDFARRTYIRSQGVYLPAYDPMIGAAMAQATPIPPLWPAFESLEGKPTLLVHGAISDLLTDDIVEKMRAAYPAMGYCRVPQIGHAPMLTEKHAQDALTGFFLQRD